MTPAPRLTLQLADGRTVGYRQFGAPGGAPALYCHGFPGTSIEGALIDRLAQRLGVRLVAVDRPGFGGSSDHPEKSFAGWPDDVTAVADELGLDRFPILGMSGGAPFALACGWRLAGRVTRVGVVSGMGPVTEGTGLREMMAFNRAGLRLARAIPGGMMACRGVFRAVLRHRPEAVVAHLQRVSASRDRELLRDSPLREILISSFRESTDPGGRGLVQEAVLFGLPWGDWLRELDIEVLLWHGERDVVVPPSVARVLAGSLPRCRASFHPDDGHFSLPLGQAEAIIEALMS